MILFQFFQELKLMIDSHCHLNFENISINFDSIIKRSINNGISAILSINTNPKEFKSHYKLIKKYKSLFISYGLHPTYINSKNIISTNEIKNFSKYERVIGIGETGLDFFHSLEYKKEQYKSFENHIEACIETNLPLIIHQRNCENQIIDILSNYKDHALPLVMHCFTGSKKLLYFCLDSNYYISLSGIITFNNSNELREIIHNMPLNLLLIETDSPFLTPHPHRGKKPNEPSYVYFIGKYLAEFFNIPINEFENITNNNFYSLFKKAIRYKEILYEN